jgi:glycerol-3-phosphate acyltransferase PlsX
LRIAIDAMGGDYGPRVTVPAAITSLARHPGLEVVLLGREAELTPLLERCDTETRRRISICHCEQVVEMGDKPSQALRSKKNSSMRVAIDQLKAGEVDACVSAGNTGALMAIGCYILKTSPGIDRPAICVAMPVDGGHSYLLDLGANVDNCSEHLHQFALMGSVLSRVLDGKAQPRVALLNIGHEEIKGNEQVKLAAQLIGEDARINYTGYVEADRLFYGDADVIVCDGFVGNIALKAAEGAARLIGQKSKQAFERNGLTRFIGWMARPVMRRVREEISPEAHNGAYFLGLQGVLVKSHGAASVQGFHHAIENAIVQVENRMVGQLDHALELLVD